MQEQQKSSRSRLFLTLFALLFVILIALGATGLIFHARQQPISATITATGEITNSRTRRSSHYSIRLTVRFEEDGIPRNESLSYPLQNYWLRPRAGNTVLITRNPFGACVAYPDTRLENDSWVLIIIPAVFLFICLWLLRQLSVKETASYFQEPEAPSDPFASQVPHSDQITDRITLHPDGVYRWYGMVDAEYTRRKLHHGMKLFCIIMIVSFALFSLILILMGQGDGLGIVFLVLGLIVALCLLIVFLSAPRQATRERFELYDTWLGVGVGKSRSFFTFSKARRVTCDKNYIELQGRWMTLRAYASEEDLPFLREYILPRLPSTVQISEK